MLGLVTTGGVEQGTTAICERRKKSCRLVGGVGEATRSEMRRICGKIVNLLTSRNWCLMLQWLTNDIKNYNEEQGAASLTTSSKMTIR